MKLLAIDTSGRRGSIAVAEGTAAGCRIIAQSSLGATPRTAQTLAPTIKGQLSAANWEAAELEGVVVTCGPGSFTGLRLGVVTAKSLAYATGAALAAVPTLAAMAVNRNAEARPVWSVLDAQRDEVFAARFTEEPAADSHPEVLLISVDEFAGRLHPGDAVATPAVDKLRDRLPKRVIVLPGIDDGPAAASVAQLGWAMLQAGQTVEPLQLVPNYYRRSAAEEKAASQT